MKRHSLQPLVIIVVSITQLAGAGRHESFTEKAAQGPKLKVLAATYFGGDGIEEFVSAGGLPDGSIVAFGNAWGPQFPADPPPLVLGRGRHRGLDPMLLAPEQKKPSPREDDPDAAGMLVFYAPNLASVKKVVRFDWGVANISSAAVARDGKSILIAGRCTAALRDAVRSGLKVVTSPPEKGRGPYEYASEKPPGDVYIARLPLSGDGILWACVFEGARTPPQELWLDYEQNIYADIHGLVRLSPDGQTATRIETIIATTDPKAERRTLTSTHTAHYLGVDPKDGSFYYGGDRNTNTGFQPWRQPYLYKFDHDGRRQWKLWEWAPKDCACGGIGNGLCSDSSPRVMDVAPDETLVVGGWSDGGNSVFTRQPNDVTKPAGWKGFGMDASGMKGANSLSYILKIDPKTRRLTDGTLFVGYMPMTMEKPKYRGAPNFTSLHHIRTLDDGAIAFTGSAATGLIQTPGAFYKEPGDGSGYGGEFAAVFSSDFHNLMFSSYLPGCENANVAVIGKQVIVVSRSKGDDGEAKPTATPTVNAIQKEKHGPYDAHILLLSE